MDLKFGIVLAGFAARPWKKDDEPLVDGLARGGIAEGCERGEAGFGQFPGNGLDNEPRGRTRETQNRDRGAPHARGNGIDRVMVHWCGFTVSFWHSSLVYRYTPAIYPKWFSASIGRARSEQAESANLTEELLMPTVLDTGICRLLSFVAALMEFRWHSTLR